MDSNDIKKLFNAMSFDNRTIAIASELRARIIDIEIAKKRLKSNYDRELKYLNDKIKIYNDTIKKL